MLSYKRTGRGSRVSIGNAVEHERIGKGKVKMAEVVKW